MRRLLLVLVLALAACSSDEPRKVKLEFEVTELFQEQLRTTWRDVPADRKTEICADESNELGVAELLADLPDFSHTDPETLFNVRYFLDNTACG